MHGLLLQTDLSTVQEEVEKHVGDYQNLAAFKGNAHLTVNLLVLFHFVHELISSVDV